LAIHFRQLQIQDIRQETEDCISVSFLIPEQWKEEFNYKAGQNISLRSTVGNEELRRTYSICNSPHEHELRIAIKKVVEGKFSSYAHDHLHSKDWIDVLPPAGNFILPMKPENKNHYVAFAAGSGITPVIAILKTILLEEPESRITLIYGNRMRNTIIFREELENIKNNYPERFQLIHIFSREKTDLAIQEGRIDAEKCALIFKHLVPLSNNEQFLLCGPAPMIFSLREWLLNQKIDTKKIHYELFSDPGESAAFVKKDSPENKINPGEKSVVTIRLDGVSQEYHMPKSGSSILAFAIQEGADLPYACKAGVCASCRAKLIEGKITMDQNYALADEELEEGFILACQAHPVSNKLTIDFDIR